MGHTMDSVLTGNNSLNPREWNSDRAQNKDWGIVAIEKVTTKHPLSFTRLQLRSFYNTNEIPEGYDLIYSVHTQDVFKDRLQLKKICFERNMDLITEKVMYQRLGELYGSKN